MSKKIKQAQAALETLTVYRGLLRDRVVSAYYRLLERLAAGSLSVAEFCRDYCHFYYLLLEEAGDVSFSEYLAEKILFAENAFSRACEREKPGVHLMQAAERDFGSLKLAALLSARELKEAAISLLSPEPEERKIVLELPEWPRKDTALPENVEKLADFYARCGTGEFARFSGFIWQRTKNGGELCGIKSIDPVRFSDLIGYEKQHRKVIENTLQFLDGYPANNVLLYGDRGTGKSSTVKALLNDYVHLGLRMIELPRKYLDDLPQVIALISGRPQKFIIFIDDLSFTDSDEIFTGVKAFLEGSLTSRPQNVLIYATSNRRHLVKENFAERSAGYADGDDEVRAGETVEEKLSLADRFGLAVYYINPDRHGYLEIVEGLARRRGLQIPKEELHREAINWEMRQNGRSPRTARQFIDWLEGRLKLQSGAETKKNGNI